MTKLNVKSGNAPEAVAVTQEKSAFQVRTEKINGLHRSIKMLAQLKHYEQKMEDFIKSSESAEFNFNEDSNATRILINEGYNDKLIEIKNPKFIGEVAKFILEQLKNHALQFEKQIGEAQI